MWSLRHAAEPPIAGLPPLLPGALGLALALFLAAGALPPGVGQGAVAAAGQAIMLGAALLAGGARPGSGGCRRGDAAVAAVLLVLGAVGAGLDPRAAAGRVGLLLWLGWLAARGRLGGLTPGPVRPAGLVAGAGVGALLGLHLLVAASRTLGYRAGLDAPGPWLAGLAYDAGANVPATAGFFLGAVYDRAQRRWSGPAAAALATAGLVVRYLADPLLPGTLEVVTGMVFYVAALGGAGTWLAWWAGSPAPGALALLLFFAAWRLLGTA